MSMTVSQGSLASPGLSKKKKLSVLRKKDLPDPMPAKQISFQLAMFFAKSFKGMERPSGVRRGTSGSAQGEQGRNSGKRRTASDRGQTALTAGET